MDIRAQERLSEFRQVPLALLEERSNVLSWSSYQAATTPREMEKSMVASAGMPSSIPESITRGYRLELGYTLTGAAESLANSL